MGPPKNTPLKGIRRRPRPLTALRGIGPKKAGLLARKGLYTLLDLLSFLPSRYEDRSRITPIAQAEEDDPVLVQGTVLYGREERFYPSGKRLFKIRVKDGTGPLELLWFQYRKPYLNRYTAPGKQLLAFGKIKTLRGTRQMAHPDVLLADKNRDGALGIFPVYSHIPGFSNHQLRTVIRLAMEATIMDLPDPLPISILRNLGLPTLGEALQTAHTPPPGSSLELLNRFNTPAHRRLIFDRFFHVMLAMAFRRKVRETIEGAAFSIPENPGKKIAAFFPFELTLDQGEAIKEIAGDLATKKPMNRLLMGDVGCGKTVVAAAAAHLTILNGRQVAMMVPTQVLADQHMAYFSSLPRDMGFRTTLLKGTLKASNRRDLHQGIERGAYNLIIGTQALIQERVSFSNLGLVIIDEQHRFGVRQRTLLEEKGQNPNLLVMTATPIPRTLAITLYGDLTISTIKEAPKGVRPVITRAMGPAQKREVYETVLDRLSKGEQAIVICPVIEKTEESDLKAAEDMAEKLKRVFFPRFRIGLIHGRLGPEEKENLMEDFRKGRIDLLVGTTVIEVGIHAPKATVMIIEHPERFGLAQLHQLRGRVGRGTRPGICFLMIPEDRPDQSIERLDILVKSHDGFEIAQRDLEHRGQGELTGLKQAGAGELDFADMLREPELLKKAKEEADHLIDKDPSLSNPENAVLKVMVASLLADPIDG